MIVDLFAGMGGWDVGLGMLGVSDVVGIEHDAAACATRAAAGHRTIRADVDAYAACRFRGRIDGLIASPPCQDFSAAGKRAGIEGARGELMWQVPLWVRATRPRWVACEQVPLALEWWNRFAVDLESLGYRTWFGVLNAADYGVPQTRKRAFLLASLDRLPGPPEATHARSPQPSLFGATLEPWVSMAEALGWGMTSEPYPVIASGRTTGGPDREQVGGSGAREFLYGERDAGRFVVRTGNNSMVTGREGSRAGDGDVQEYERPVTEPAPTLDAKVGGAWTVEHRRGGERIHEGRDPHAEPAETITSRVDRWQVNTGKDWKPGGTRDDAQRIPVSEPAPTVNSGHGGVGLWFLERRAMTVQGDPRIAKPGHHNENSPQMEDAIRLTIADALVLQSFPADYPVQGTKTKQFEQVGNAVPPVLAAAVLRQFTR